MKEVAVAAGGMDGIMYDDFADRIILTNHSRPIGTVVALDPATGAITATVQLADNGPEGAASDGTGKLFVNNEGTSTMQVIDTKTWNATASRSPATAAGPTAIACARP